MATGLQAPLYPRLLLPFLEEGSAVSGYPSSCDRLMRSLGPCHQGRATDEAWFNDRKPIV